jgi:hypothetical protein
MQPLANESKGREIADFLKKSFQNAGHSET